jgi:hypothetical protein
MNAHYEAVLSDLKQMKADAEAGIAAIERLMNRDKPKDSLWDTGDNEPQNEKPRLQVQKHVQPYADGIPQRVSRFLASQPGGSYSVAEIAEAIGANNVQTLRGALIRMVKSGRVGKYGRGRYRAPRRNAATTTAEPHAFKADDSIGPSS